MNYIVFLKKAFELAQEREYKFVINIINAV